MILVLARGSRTEIQSGGGWHERLWHNQLSAWSVRMQRSRIGGTKSPLASPPQFCCPWYWHNKRHLIHCNHILVTSVAFLLCAWHIKSKECLQFEQSVVEKFLSFVKLVSPARKPHFWSNLWLLWSYIYLALESFLVAWLHMWEFSQIGLLQKDTS